MQESNDLYWRYYMCFGLSKIVSAYCTSNGFIPTKVTSFSMVCKAMKGDYIQGIKARISVSKVTRSKLNFWFLKTVWTSNQTDCREAFVVTSLRCATQQWRPSKWLTPTTRPRTLELFDVMHTFDIRNTCCWSISAEIRLCWHWILCFGKM